MGNHQEIVGLLTRDELVAAVDSLGLQVEDRRAKQKLAEAITKAEDLSLEGVLGCLPRGRLKEICRALQLDDSGKEKAPIVARLLAANRGAPSHSRTQAATPAYGKRGSKNGAENYVQKVELQGIAGKLTVDQLERYLWSAADILRGSIDSSDYKGYIIGFLFMKRLSDVFEEEAEKLIAEGEDPEVAWSDPDEHQFFVPERARWGAIQKVATNIGEALNKACLALEEHNGQTLEGVLAGIDFNDERRLGDTKNRDSVLSRLVQHFSKVSLRNESLSEPDMLGRAYEYLIERFADGAGKKGGEFYTPHRVVEVMVEILAPKPGMRISDPTCGSGGMLIQCAKYVQRHGGDPRDLALHGQEKNLGTWAIAKMNLLLHGFADHRIEKGDTIRDPKLLQEGELMLYDRVIANPPFSLDEWGRDFAENDPFGRFRFGIPPKTKGDFAFVQHMVATLNTKGRLAVVMPHGVLFRGSSEGEIRKGMLEADLLEAVIGLPPMLFYGTGIPAAILVLNRRKAPERHGKILFVDASREFKAGSAKNYLREADVQKISGAFHAFKDEPRYAKVVGLEQVRKNDWNLNISRFVETAEAEDRVDVAAAVQKLRGLEAERAAAEAKMNAFLEELGYGS